MQPILISAVHGELRRSPQGEWQYKVAATVVHPDGRTELWDRGTDWATIGPTNGVMFPDLAQEAVDDMAHDVEIAGSIAAVPWRGPKVHWRGADEESEAFLREFGVA
jgi:hypothetical protein